MLCVLGVTAHAATIDTVSLSIGNVQIQLPSKPVRIDGIVYVPLETLRFLGAEAKPEGALKQDGQKIEVVSASEQKLHFHARCINGEPMLSISEIAPKLGAVIAWDGTVKNISIRAKIQRIGFNGSDLSIVTSFPVSYSAVWWKSAHKLILDVAGAQIPASESPIDNLSKMPIRTGTRDGGESCRIVIDMPGTATYRVVSAPKTSKIQLSISLTSQPKVLKGRIPPTVITEAPKTTIEPATYEPPVIISAIDYHKQGSRFVISISGDRPIKNATVKTFMLKNPERLTLDIANASLARTLDDISVANEIVRNIRTGQKDSGIVRVVLDLTRPVGFNTQQGDTPDKLAISLDLPKGAGGLLSQKTIVIDPGHGGSQPGAVGCTGAFEKNYTLAIATRLQKALSDAGACALMTRKGDETLGLGARVDVARRNAADIFVSIHINSCQVRGAISGIETFHHGYDGSGMALAQCVHSEIMAVTDLRDLSVKSDYKIYNNGFQVLRDSSAAGIPAILVEVGFINNPNDESKISDPTFQQQIAEAITKGLKAYVEGTK